MGDATGGAVSQRFRELFPALVPKEPTAAEREADAEDGAVDISVDELALRPLEQEVEAHLYEALQRWNSHTAASGEATMPYMQRLKKYRAIARWMLYEDEQPHPDDEGAVVPAGTVTNPTAGELRRLRKQQQKTRRAEIAKFKRIFGALPPIATLREQRRPSARLERFVEQFPPKKKAQAAKRSVADTQTTMCFEFARRAPRTAVDGETEGADTEEESEEIQRPTATTAATWRSRTLLASVEAQQEKTQPRNPTAVEAQSEAQDELLMWIDVLHPSKDPARTQSFLVLGSDMVSDLLDLIVCAYDQRFKEHECHGKLLFFNKQFYVDRRHEQNTDYAANILEWIIASPIRIAKYVDMKNPPIPPKRLDTTTFADLALKIDTPGVYIHQGECEHLVRLRDVRLLNPAIDTTNRQDFPMRLMNPLQRHLRSCLVCSNYSAKYVTYGDRMASTDPMFYCERCYRAAHFDRDGQLIFSDYQAFHYIQD